jgi:hypothetical protein
MDPNRVIHAELQERGMVSGDEHAVKVLTPRQDMTGVDRARAAQYEPGDVVLHQRQPVTARPQVCLNQQPPSRPRGHYHGLHIPGSSLSERCHGRNLTSLRNSFP